MSTPSGPEILGKKAETIAQEAAPKLAIFPELEASRSAEGISSATRSRSSTTSTGSKGNDSDGSHHSRSGTPGGSGTDTPHTETPTPGKKHFQFFDGVLVRPSITEKLTTVFIMGGAKGNYPLLVSNKKQQSSAIEPSLPTAVVFCNEAVKPVEIPIVPVAIKLSSKVQNFYPTELSSLLGQFGSDRPCKNYFVVQQGNRKAPNGLSLHYEHAVVKEETVKGMDRGLTISVNAQTYIVTSNESLTCTGAKLLLMDSKKPEVAEGQQKSKPDMAVETKQKLDAGVEKKDRLEAVKEQKVIAEKEKPSCIRVTCNGSSYNCSSSGIVIKGMSKLRVESFHSVVVPEEGPIICTTHWLVPEQLLDDILGVVKEINQGKKDATLKTFMETIEAVSAPFREVVQNLRSSLGSEQSDSRSPSPRARGDSSPLRFNDKVRSGSVSEIDVDASLYSVTSTNTRTRFHSQQLDVIKQEKLSRQSADGDKGNTGGKPLSPTLSSAKPLNVSPKLVHASIVAATNGVQGRARADSESGIAAMSRPSAGARPVHDIAGVDLSRKLDAFKSHATRVKNITKEKQNVEAVCGRVRGDTSLLGKARRKTVGDADSSAAFSVAVGTGTLTANAALSISIEAAGAGASSEPKETAADKSPHYVRPAPRLPKPPIEAVAPVSAFAVTPIAAVDRIAPARAAGAAAAGSNGAAALMLSKSPAASLSSTAAPASAVLVRSTAQSPSKEKALAPNKDKAPAGTVAMAVAKIKAAGSPPKG